MPIKLTLSLDEEVIEAAKDYVRDHNQSLSSVVEEYLRALIAPKEKEPHFSPRIQNLRGVISLPHDFDYKSTLSQEIQKKYGI